MTRFLWILPLGAMVALIAQQPVLVRQNGNTAAVTAAGALKTDGSAVTQPVSGTVTANQGGAPWSVTVSTFPDNEPFNLAQYGGVAVGAGNAIHVQPGTGAIFAASQSGTWTVQPGNTANTTAWLVTGTGGTFPATQSGNWTTRIVGNGGAVLDAVTTAATAPASGLAVLGVYNSTELSPTTGQSTALQLDAKGRLRNVIMDAAGNTRGANVNASNQLSVSIDGSTATNISTNVAQVNGVAVTTGNGVSGTGVQRVTIASDSTGTVAVTQATSSNLKAQVDPLTAASWGLGATGAAPPSSGNFQTGIGSGATGGLAIGPTICDQWVAINGTASAQLISGVASRKIYFCSGNIQMNGGANTISFVSGTGSTCGTGTTAVPGFDGATTAANGYSFAANSGMTWDGANGAAFARTTNNADNFCILVGSATRVVGGLSYAIY